MSERLLTDTGIFTIALVASRAIAVVFLLVLPAFLWAADYGVLVLATMVTALSASLLTEKVSQRPARFFPGSTDKDKQRLAGTAFAFISLILGCTAGLAVLLAGQLTPALLGNSAYVPAFRAAWILAHQTCAGERR